MTLGKAAGSQAAFLFLKKLKRNIGVPCVRLLNLAETAQGYPPGVRSLERLLTSSPGVPESVPFVTAQPSHAM